MAAIAEKLVGMGFLKVVAADFLARNLRGNGQNWYAAALAVVEPVDQVHIARPATSGANRQFACQVGLGACGKCPRLFVTHANPLNFVAPANLLQKAVERVAHDPVNPRHACRDHGFDKNSRHSFLRHILFLASATFIGGRWFDYMVLRKTAVPLPKIQILDCSDQVELLSEPSRIDIYIAKLIPL